MAAATRLGRVEWAITALQQLLGDPDAHLDEHMKKALDIRLRLG
jgi:hypothetical protein